MSVHQPGVGITCDGCGVQFDIRARLAQDVRRAARETGWVAKQLPDEPGNLVDLCPECQPDEDQPVALPRRQELGHQFHFSVCVQGAYRDGDGVYQDAAEPVEYDPFTLTVRAWNLADACRMAAETPLSEWKHAEEDLG